MAEDHQAAQARQLAAVSAPPMPGADPQGDFLLRWLEMKERQDEARREDDRKAKEAAMQIPKQRFDFTINTGNVLVLVGLVITSLAGYGAWTASMEKLNGLIATNAAEIKRNFDEDAKRTITYAPQIEDLKKMVATIVGRQDNQGDSIMQLRGVVADLAKVVGDQVKVGAEMHESLAIMKMQQDRDRGVKVGGAR